MTPTVYGFPRSSLFRRAIFPFRFLLSVNRMTSQVSSSTCGTSRTIIHAVMRRTSEYSISKKTTLLKATRSKPVSTRRGLTISASMPCTFWAIQDSRLRASTLLVSTSDRRPAFLRIPSSRYWSGKGIALPPSPPLRTVRESFPSYSSSLSFAP